ncbi:unnamed protein product [Pylaiella littoralis]
MIQLISSTVHEQGKRDRSASINGKLYPSTTNRIKRWHNVSGTFSKRGRYAPPSVKHHERQRGVAKIFNLLQACSTRTDRLVDKSVRDSLRFWFLENVLRGLSQPVLRPRL